MTRAKKWWTLFTHLKSLLSDHGDGCEEEEKQFARAESDVGLHCVHFFGSLAYVQWPGPSGGWVSYMNSYEWDTLDEVLTCEAQLNHPSRKIERWWGIRKGSWRNYYHCRVCRRDLDHVQPVQRVHKRIEGLAVTALKEHARWHADRAARDDDETSSR